MQHGCVSGCACTVSGCAQSPCTALWLQPETGTAAPAAAAAWPPAWHGGDLCWGCRRSCGCPGSRLQQRGRALQWGICSGPKSSVPGWGVQSSSSAASGPRCCSPAPHGAAIGILYPREHLASSPTQQTPLSSLALRQCIIYSRPLCCSGWGWGPWGRGASSQGGMGCAAEGAGSRCARQRCSSSSLFFFFFLKKTVNIDRALFC